MRFIIFTELFLKILYYKNLYYIVYWIFKKSFFFKFLLLPTIETKMLRSITMINCTWGMVLYMFLHILRITKIRIPNFSKRKKLSIIPQNLFYVSLLWQKVSNFMLYSSSSKFVFARPLQNWRLKYHNPLCTCFAIDCYLDNQHISKFHLKLGS